MSKFSLETLTYLPPSVKNLILNKFCSQYYNQNETLLYDILSALVNSTTSEIDLTCFEVDARVLLIFNNCHSLKKLHMRNHFRYICKYFPHKLRDKSELKTLKRMRSKPSPFTPTGIQNIKYPVNSSVCIICNIFCN